MQGIYVQTKRLVELNFWSVKNLIRESLKVRKNSTKMHEKFMITFCGHKTKTNHTNNRKTIK